SALLVERINETGDPNIIVGTEIGEIIVFSSSGTVQWRESISEGRPIRQLLLVNAPNGVPRLVAVTANNMYSTTLDDNLAPRIATYEKKINQLFSLNQPGNELAGRMLALADNAHGLNWRGIQLPGWPLRITGTPLVTVRADDIVQDSFEADTAESFLLATDANEVLRLTVRDNEPELLWTIAGNEDVTSLYWGDLDGNTIPEFSVGDAAGRVQLFTSGPQPKNVDDLSLSSGVFALTAVRRGADNRADLLVITDNGEVQLFSAQENHPPLLTNPGTEVSAGQYGFNVTIQDIEEDQVRVRLDIQDPFTGDWEAQREAVQPNGNGSLFWNVVNTQAAADGLHYRYYYDDGFHDGFIYPAVGPLPILPPVESELPIPVPLLLLLASAIFSFLLARQLRTPTMRTRRFYRRLQKQPAQILLLLENKYSSTGGSPELLLSLSGLARQKQDPHISSLADGLYLLAERPQMGLPIINSMLAEVAHLEPKWVDIDRWLLIFNTGEELLQTPSMTELSLLLPQLQETLTRLQAESLPSTLLSELRPPLTSIRDSERVDRSDDRLVYLNEASRQLAALQKNMPAFATTIEKPLTAAIVHRWAGLVSAEIEELRGRAELLITLKTKRIIPSKQTQVTFEIQNNGRAPAENVTAVLEEDPAYTVKSAPQTIPFLPPRHTRQITFDIQPTVSDRFRVGLIVTYDDRNRPGKQFAFGDQVNLLLPARDFEPVPNEYRPGTPLRQNSSVFYGRQGLFNFIADNVGSLSQRNVLILIGQRRTGKTSALLNLEQHLPDHLLPVYIDCQSLGVVPGMAALFHDWAWFIADTLATHDIEIEVPEMDAWETDPTGMFQRHFLPATRQLLDYETTLLLVFDEFEVFEHLVNDGILPPTFFNFLRHLMQHSEGLSFVFVGTRRLEEMSADYWSVMFNIALYQRITYLRDESATRLITEPVAPYLVYDDLALDKILRVTAGHPYFLQLVCYTLVKQANHQQRGYVTISDVNAALDEMLSLGEVHFAYLWRRSSYTERAILTAVSHMMEREEPFRPEDFVQFLDPYGFHLNPKEVTAALNTLVEREIMSELQDGATTQYELRLGLVGIWTAQHKSLSKLHASSSNGAAKNGNPRSPKKVV
ncbi:MAG: AAA family ATPase, partial [Chloroflexi bacterium]|nr:AAA family ATPase [Chloroflexota bacterium]